MTANTILFNDNWQFCLTDIDEIKDPGELSARRRYDVEIPHDWLIGNTAELYKSGEGWYRKSLTADAEMLSGRVLINFDGVYMDSTLYINGIAAGGNTYGYSAFEIDITDLLHEGDNELLVRVRHRSPNTRWYSGAGIFRDVELKTRPATYIKTNGIYIHSDRQDNGSFVTEIETSVVGAASDIRLTLEVVAPFGGVIAGFEQKAVFGGGEECFLNTFTIDDPMIWDIDAPHVYTMRISLFGADGKLLHSAEECFGYKTAEFVPEKGLVLNGKQIKLHGVCMHHDLGALGAAYNFHALLRQLRMMKAMGANSIRTSHNMPAKQLMQICDKIGLLVDSESFDMWENPKTEFDNARFFKETAETDVKSWVERDRNHPSLLMWSIGNEISDTNDPHGIEITKRLRDFVHKYDPKGNAPATIGSNFMGSENAQKCSDELKIAGYNYSEVMYEKHHKQYPDWTIYGSETASAVRSRGIYHFPAELPLLTYDDLQCSSLDNSVVGWGSSAAKSWRLDRDCDFCAGQYIWTGFDYIGEPTPYSTKNSYFGIVDTAGFPKDIYYFYQSVWLDPKIHPVIHIVPSYWDFNPGQKIDVIIYSNAYSVELFLNGRSLGKHIMDLENSMEMRAHYIVPFERGILSAKGFDKDGSVISEDKAVSCGDPAKIIMKADRSTLSCDGRDISFIEISTVDKDGVEVGNARNRIKLEVSGAGRLVGLDNGDSTDYDSYKGDNRRLFSGKLLAMIQSCDEEGEITVKASSVGLESAEIVLAAVEADSCTGISVVKANAFPVCMTEYTDEVPVRKIELSGGGKLDSDHRSAVVTARLFPANATYGEITWKVIRETGVEIPLADIEPTENGAIITARGDGEFMLRASVSNGGDIPQVYCDLPFTATGLGAAVRNAYEFTSAGTLDDSDIPVNYIEDGALGGFDGRTAMSYDNIDFGRTGSEELLLYIGTCGDVSVEVRDGDPVSGELLVSGTFQNNGHWCGFAPQAFALPHRLRGTHRISVVIDSRIIFGGFEFVPINRAFDENFTAECDSIYGDDFSTEGKSVVKIGNNVILNYSALDFGADGTDSIVINGSTPNPTNAVQLRYTPEGGEQASVFLDFAKCDVPTERKFTIPTLVGVNDISFVFLPGTKFDFISFRFEKRSNN